MSEGEKNPIVIHSLENTPLNFPKPSEFVTEDFAKKARDCIQKYGVRDGNGKTAVNARALKVALRTDDVGAKKFYNRLPEKDKFKDGNERYVRTPVLKRELDERIEKPHDAKKIEEMKEVERCLTALRDNYESQRQRALSESNIRSGQRFLKGEKIARDNITECEHSGLPLEPNAHAHHKERRADDPDLALDLNNIEVVNPMPHEEHHRQEKKIEFN